MKYDEFDLEKPNIAFSRMQKLKIDGKQFYFSIAKRFKNENPPAKKYAEG